MNNFGAAKRPNIKKNLGPRGSEGGVSNLTNSPEMIYVCGFFLLPIKVLLISVL